MKIYLIGLILLVFQSALAQQNGLIAHYKFDKESNQNSGTISDNSSNNNHGQMYGGLKYAEDRFGVGCSAMDFDGTEYISVPSSRSLESPSTGFTAAVWFRLENGADFFNQWITIICKSDQLNESDNSPQYRMQATAQTVSINTAFTENFIPQLKYDTWYFYAITFDGNQVNVYLDGSFVFQYNYYGTLTGNSMPLEIGRDLPGAQEYFYGQMDDLRIYDRALSKSELNQLYLDNSGANSADRCNTYSPPPSPPNPVVVNPQPTPKPPVVTTPSLPPVVVDEDGVVTVPPDIPEEPIDTAETVVEEAKPTPETDPDPMIKDTLDTPPPSLAEYKNLPDTVGGQAVKYQKVVYVKSRDVKIYPYDNEKEDGDIVSININGVWVRNKLRLKKKASQVPASNLIYVSLNPGENNYIVSKAWNLGRIPPNTLTIEIFDGNSVQEIMINSEVGLSGGIKIVHQ